MAEITLNSFTETLDVLIDANPHARNKGDEFKAWSKDNFGCDARISYIKEQRQITNRVSEQFRYFAPIVIFVCVPEVKRDVLVKYILERVYKQLENVAIIGAQVSAAGKVDYKFEQLIVFKRTAFTEWAEAFFEQTGDARSVITQYDLPGSLLDGLGIDYAWYVGTTGNDENGQWRDFSDEYIDSGTWVNGWDDKFIDVVKSIAVGDRIAIKSTFTQKKNLPFDNHGKTVGAMRIKAIGTVTENIGDGKTIKVDWTRLDPFKTWFGPGVLREAIHHVDAADGYIKKQLLAFTFGDEEQDYSLCEERYQDDIDSSVGVDEVSEDDTVTNTEDSATSPETKENERRFREWMSTQTSSAGTICTPSMISANSSALKRVCGMMDIVEYPDVNNLFAITDIDTFLDIKAIIRSHADFDDVNKACGNGFLKSALNWYEKYLNYILSSRQEAAVQVDEYDKDKFLDEVFMTSEEYDELVRLVLYKKNIILQGAPGVGKTFLAKRFAYSMLGKKCDANVEMVQFHQSYSYEDFIMGYKPNDDGFELKTGVFYNFCKKASKDPNPNSKYFFIVDEINRGNLSKIFGELMMLIESDKRGQKHGIKLAYRDEVFFVPENLYIIGMMNTADRSLAMMDYALRRRFSFYEVEPAFGKPKFKVYLEKYIHTAAVVDKVINRFKELNTKIADEDNSGLGRGFCIGHSYFCVPPVASQDDESWYKAIIKYEVAPLLDEYWWDDKAKAEDCIKDLLKD